MPAMAINTDLFNVEAARNATAETAREMRKNVKSRISAIKRTDGELRIAAAYAMYSTYLTEEKVNPTDLARDMGTARANVYFWKRLGIAVVDLGVEPNTMLWTRLNATANAKPVAWILDGLGRDGLGDPDTREQRNDGSWKKGEANIAPTMDELMWALNLAIPLNEKGEPERKSGKDVDVALAAEGIGAVSAKVADEAATELSLTVNKRLAVSLDYIIANVDKISVDEYSALHEKFAQVFNLVEPMRKAAVEKKAPAAKKTAAKKVAQVA